MVIPLVRLSITLLAVVERSPRAGTKATIFAGSELDGYPARSLYAGYPDIPEA